MDIEKLIERLRTESLYADKASLEIMDLCMDAATALSTLRAENSQLRESRDHWKRLAHELSEGVNGKDAEHERLQAENEKLRAELESKEKYYEQMIDALSATDSADLAQMTACVYYKPGGLCRYGGDDPANVCVLGPCPHERTAEEVLADLARMTAERDAAVSWAQKFTESIDRPCVACKHNTGDYVCTAICGNCGPMGAESCKWEFDFSGELKED